MLKRYWLWLGCIYYISGVGLCYAQGRAPVDSLRSIAEQGSDTQRVNAYNQLSALLRNNNPNEARTAAEQAMWLALRSGYRRGLANAYNRLGATDYFQGNYTTAFDHYQKALTIYDELRDSANVANCENNIGLIHTALGNYTESLKHVIVARDLYTRQGDQVGLGSAYNNIGVVYKNLGRFDDAITELEKSLAIKQAEKDSLGLGNSYNNLGEVFELQGDYSRAYNYYVKSINLKQKKGDRYGMAVTSNNLASLSIKTGNLGLALTYASRALAFAQTVGSRDAWKNAYKNLADVYYLQNNLPQAYSYQSQYVRLRDQLQSDENARKVLDMQTANDLRRKEVQIQILNKDNEIQELQLGRQRILLISLGLVLVIAIGSIVFVVRVNRQKQVINERLQTQNIEIQQQRDEIERKNAQLINTLEELRATQEQLIASEKMAALGKLVANVAHEVNTPIAAIRATSKTLEQMMPAVINTLPDFLGGLSPAEVALFRILAHNELGHLSGISAREERQLRKELQEALQEAQFENADELASQLVQCGVKSATSVAPLLLTPRYGDVVRQAARMNQIRLGFLNIQASTEKTGKVVLALKMLADRGQSGAVQTRIELRANIEGVLKLYSNYLRNGVQLQTQWPDKLVFVQADAEDLAQVWTHIVFNAVQAVAGSGKVNITLETSEKEGIATFDNDGPEIPAEVMTRIFEPFFSTKGKGEGSGLGLYVSRQVVERLGGSITVASRDNLTRFTVRLPLS